MVPVFLAAAPMVPHAVLAEEKVIIRNEGWFHVAERYFASAPDADRMRRLEAERRVAERARLEGICAWCNKRILANEPSVQISYRWVHAKPCALEFDAFVYGGERPAPDPAAAAGPGGENDPRWALVTDNTPVEFDGELCRWADLMLADRKTVEMRPDGSLVGGYPI